MRGLVPGLLSPYPLGEQLPALYRGDELAQRLTGALDEVMAPIFATLDGFPAYLDPAVAPEDMLDWLGEWVGVALDHTWPIERRRAFVASAVDLFRLRGTAMGLAAHVAIFSGGQVEIEESGAAGWSASPGAAIPGEPTPSLLVRVRVKDPASVSAARLDALVAAAKPAHVPHRIEIVAG
jgi:phage tail-like protein